MSGELPGLESQLQDCPTEMVSIAVLRLGNSLRIKGEDHAHVRVLAESQAELPPILVHADTMEVIDGAHRVRAAVLRGDEEIRARLYTGDADDAFVLAVLLNSRHGLPLTAADRTAAAERIMKVHPQWSDRRVARLAGLSPTTVAGLRRRSTDQSGHSHTRLGSDGRARPVSGAGGRLQARELLLSSPELSLRQVAKVVGIAPSTVRDVRDRIAAGQDPLPPRQRRSAASASREMTSREKRTGTGLGHQAPAASRPQAPDRGVLLQRLRNDPSLRFSEAGRNLLRWLGQHAHESAELGNVVERVPPHCAATVAELIRANLEAWAECVSALEQRADVPYEAEQRCAS
ncbi:ParB-like nuclease domain-containing protein [Streptomyces sp. ISL-10]|uniref:ParB/RepB/Spo0J family partition protein n=1 Tax=Streptomyces sp. ISL-10 TaxID=2819172 RepID=UPI001BE6AE6C|nr:ParB/RepB/Spo0J family partition protein [Streptomyces sp. ISL-10]MBT2364805.1 ParB-like nuclease domain-containing protein [Streptomyces sp. ISL-10]